LADKKKTTRKAAADPEERLAGPSPSEHESATDASDAVGNAGSEKYDQLIETKSVVVEGAEVDVEDDPKPKPKRPSAKEVLNRLLEKNEIILKVNKDNAEKEKQLKDLNEKWLRSVAEFENYRKRSRKEWELLKQQSKTEVILEILNTIDDFERAFDDVERGHVAEVIQKGYRLDETVIRPARVIVAK